MGTFTGMSETFLLEVSNDNDLVALTEFDLLLFVGAELKAAVAFTKSNCHRLAMHGHLRGGEANADQGYVHTRQGHEDTEAIKQRREAQPPLWCVRA